MPNDPHPVPEGTRGTIDRADDADHIHVKWDNGSSLSLIPGVDEWQDLIDVNNDYWYDGKSDERTKKRLTQIAEMGMEDVAVAQFGIRGVMSGLYIEMVWSYSDEKWNDYIDWVKTLVKEKTPKASIGMMTVNKDAPTYDQMHEANKQWAKWNAKQREEALVKYVPDWKPHIATAVPALPWRSLAWQWQHAIALKKELAALGKEIIRSLYGKKIIINGEEGTIEKMDNSGKIHVNLDDAVKIITPGKDKYEIVFADEDLSNYMGNKGEKFVIDKAGSGEKVKYYLIRASSPHRMVDMFFSSPEEAEKYAKKRGLIIKNKFEEQYAAADGAEIVGENDVINYLVGKYGVDKEDISVGRANNGKWNILIKNDEIDEDTVSKWEKDVNQTFTKGKTVYKTIAFSANKHVSYYNGELTFQNIKDLTGVTPVKIEHIKYLETGNVDPFIKWSADELKTKFGYDIQNIVVMKNNLDSGEVEILEAFAVTDDEKHNFKYSPLIHEWWSAEKNTAGDGKKVPSAETIIAEGVVSGNFGDGSIVYQYGNRLYQIKDGNIIGDFDIPEDEESGYGNGGGVEESSDVINEIIESFSDSSGKYDKDEVKGEAKKRGISKDDIDDYFGEMKSRKKWDKRYTNGGPLSDSHTLNSFHDWLRFESPEAESHDKALGILHYTQFGEDSYLERVFPRYKDQFFKYLEKNPHAFYKAGGPVWGGANKAETEITLDNGTIFYIDEVPEELLKSKPGKKYNEYQLVAKGVNLFFLKNVVNDESALNIAATEMEDTKQPSEKDVRRAMLLKIGYDGFWYSLKAGGESASDSLYSSSLSMDFEGPNGEDVHKVIIKKYNTDFSKVLITGAEIREIKRKILKFKRSKVMRDDEVQGLIDFLISAQAKGKYETSSKGKSTGFEDYNEDFKKRIVEMILDLGNEKVIKKAIEFRVKQHQDHLEWMCAQDCIYMIDDKYMTPEKCKEETQKEKDKAHKLISLLKKLEGELITELQERPMAAANGAMVKLGDGTEISLKQLNQLSKEMYDNSSWYSLDKSDHNAATSVLIQAQSLNKTGKPHFAAHGMSINHEFTNKDGWSVEYEMDRDYPIIIGVKIDGEEMDIDIFSSDEMGELAEEAYTDHIERLIGQAEYNREDFAKDGASIGQKEKIGKVMHEFKEGTLHDSHGNLVTDRKQAIAIALSMAGIKKASRGLKITSLREELKHYNSRIDELQTELKSPEISDYRRNEIEVNLLPDLEQGRYINLSALRNILWRRFWRTGKVAQGDSPLIKSDRDAMPVHGKGYGGGGPVGTEAAEGFAIEETIIDLGQMIDQEIYGKYMKLSKEKKAELTDTIRKVRSKMKSLQREGGDEEDLKSSSSYKELRNKLGLTAEAGAAVGQEAPDDNRGPKPSAAKIVVFKHKNNPRLVITVKAYPSMSIAEIINPQNIRFPYVVGQVLNMGHRTWACNNGYLVNEEDPCPEKRVMGIKVSDIPAGHPLRHIYPGKFRADGGGVKASDGYLLAPYYANGRGDTVHIEGNYDEVVKKAEELLKSDTFVSVSVIRRTPSGQGPDRTIAEVTVTGVERF